MKLLKEMTTNFTLEDAANYQREKISLRYAYYQSSCHTRLDRAYASIELLSGYDDYVVVPVFFFDHALVLFSLGRKKKTSSFQCELCKLNNILLEDDVFNETVDEIFSKMPDVSASASERWEWFKRGLKFSAIERSGVLAYWKKADEKLLFEDLYGLHGLECAHSGSVAEELKCVKTTSQSQNSRTIEVHLCERTLRNIF